MSYYTYLTTVEPDVAFMVGWITVVSAYVLLKTTLWWLIFGTGYMITGKYSLHGWVSRTVMGVGGFILLALFNCILWMVFSPDSTFYMCSVWVSFLVAARITLREVFSLCGLLRGDWNPFGPELRFIAWDETYLLCWLGNGKGGGNRKQTPWGSYADQESAYWFQRQYNRQNGYPY